MKIIFIGPGSVAGDGDLNYHSKENDDVAKSKPVVKPVIVKGFEPVPQQLPFQPGSTPEHLSHRFMVRCYVNACKNKPFFHKVNKNINSFIMQTNRSTFVKIDQHYVS